jgi:glycerophosphoryl diester phosphodiesterase
MPTRTASVAPPEAPHRPLVFAHRGASGYRPEHTTAAYQLAFELGADAVEPDLVVSQDGVLVIRHENDISQTTDVASRREFRNRRTSKTVDGKRVTGWFTEDFTWDELSTLRAVERLKTIRSANRKYDGEFALMRLSDVLTLIENCQQHVDRQLGIVIELKHPTYFADLGFDMVTLIQRELRLAGWDRRDSRMIFECFELGVLRDLQRRGIGSSHVFLAEDHGSPADSGRGDTPHKRFSWYLSNRGLRFLANTVNGISVRKSELIRRRWLRRPRVSSLVKRARRYGLEVFAWTLRAENFFLEPDFSERRKIARWGNWQGEFALLMRSGIAAVFADQPDLAVAARNWECRRHGSL